LTREQELARAGWVKRTTYDEPRLSEIVAEYRVLGFEVHLEPFHAEDESTCAECMLQDSARYQTVYTRKRSE